MSLHVLPPPPPTPDPPISGVLLVVIAVLGLAVAALYAFGP